MVDKDVVFVDTVLADLMRLAVNINIEPDLINTKVTANTVHLGLKGLNGVGAYIEWQGSAVKPYTLNLGNQIAKFSDLEQLKGFLVVNWRLRARFLPCLDIIASRLEVLLGIKLEYGSYLGSLKEGYTGVYKCTGISKYVGLTIGIAAKPLELFDEAKGLKFNVCFLGPNNTSTTSRYLEVSLVGKGLEPKVYATRTSIFFYSRRVEPKLKKMVLLKSVNSDKFKFYTDDGVYLVNNFRERPNSFSQDVVKIDDFVLPTPLHLDLPRDSEVSSLIDHCEEYKLKGYPSVKSSKDDSEKLSGLESFLEKEDAETKDESVKLQDEGETVVKLITDKNVPVVVQFETRSNLYSLSVERAESLGLYPNRITVKEERIQKNGLLLTQAEYNRGVFSINVTENISLCESLIHSLFN